MASTATQATVIPSANFAEKRFVARINTGDIQKAPCDTMPA